MSQPNWRCVGNIGDASPLEYGGLFVFVDDTGVYPPEMELIEVVGDEENEKWEIRRVVLDNCYFENGILSDDQFHKDHPVWFFKTPQQRKERPQDSDHLRICDSIGMEEEEFINLFLSDNPLDRAIGWQRVAEYHGWDNLDSYPWKSSNREEMEERIGHYEKQLKHK